MGKAGPGSDAGPACRGQHRRLGELIPTQQGALNALFQGQMFIDISDHKRLKIRGYFQCVTATTMFL